tara:strand:+ start:242 stop:499 length:258 start_codon:yes stop_codon:yes gene_type:complete
MNIEDKLTEKQYRRMLRYVPDYGCIVQLEALPNGGVLLATSHREGSGWNESDWETVTTTYKFSGPSMRACRIFSIEEDRERDDEL